MGKQIAFFTGSRIAEDRMLSSLDSLVGADISIESRLLPKNLTPYELKHHVQNSLSDVFIVGCSRPTTLCSYVSAYTHRPVVGVPLSEVDDDMDIYDLEGVPKGTGFTTVPIDDVECGVKTALEAIK